MFNLCYDLCLRSYQKVFIHHVRFCPLETYKETLTPNCTVLGSCKPPDGIGAYVVSCMELMLPANYAEEQSKTTAKGGSKCHPSSASLFSLPLLLIDCFYRPQPSLVLAPNPSHIHMGEGNPVSPPSQAYV